jgi:hypothetical protein
MLIQGNECSLDLAHSFHIITMEDDEHTADGLVSFFWEIAF